MKWMVGGSTSKHNNIAYKGFINILFPSSENNKTFDFGPSELGARLIDEASWCLIIMPIYACME